MTRQDFLKRSALLSGALFTGLPLRFNTLPNAGIQEAKVIKLHELEDEAFVAWLVRLAARTLITTLVAQKVSDWYGSCSCNGGACSKGTAASSDYYKTEGVYGYNRNYNYFLTQYIRDQRVQFNNVSVPFLTTGNAQIMNVEGPFLAGLCWAADDVSSGYGYHTARKLFIPTSEISNGGYRFDTNPCDPTEFRTGTGKTWIGYQRNSNGGAVRVVARDNNGATHWDRTYDMHFS